MLLNRNILCSLLILLFFFNSADIYPKDKKNRLTEKISAIDKDTLNQLKIGKIVLPDTIAYQGNSDERYEIRGIVVLNEKHETYLDNSQPGYMFYIRLYRPPANTFIAGIVDKLYEEFKEKRVNVNKRHYTYPGQIIWKFYYPDTMDMKNVASRQPDYLTYIWDGQEISAVYRNKFIDGSVPEYELTRYYRELHADNPYLQALNYNYINAIDRSHAWIGTGFDSISSTGTLSLENYRLVYFDGMKLDTHSTMNTIFKENYVSSVYTDKENTVWAVMPSGIYRYDGSAWHLFDSTLKLPRKSFSSSIRVTDSTIYLLADNKIMVLKNGKWQPYGRKGSMPKLKIKAMEIDNNGKPWIVTDNELISLEGKKLKRYSSANSPLPVKGINSIAVDKEGKIWIAAGKSLYGFGLKKWEKYNFINSALPDQKISAFSIDRCDNKWIGMDGIGLAVFNENGIK